MQPTMIMLKSYHYNHYYCWAMMNQYIINSLFVLETLQDPYSNKSSLTESA